MASNRLEAAGVETSVHQTYNFNHLSHLWWLRLLKARATWFLLQKLPDIEEDFKDSEAKTILMAFRKLTLCLSFNLLSASQEAPLRSSKAL